ncbi:TPA: hypothetical protein ACG0NJ_002171 [Clostridium perfringens]|jgi:hypothetical protein|uniref:hypothetical protein n=1 Tax=Clostridium perfringens TaxID=1502 RepID=UPI001A1C4CA8|nr:hypothetical protein [Clostridium perfringens]UBK67556.1 hypothetical protein KLF46_14075 [Clostridium perfringens]HAT4232616.1 hypothetical protein [Clostridium perfringens]HAT4240339.1 hypothetical protein [Clostridium perfringens]HAT4279291.1 hypothetical protein [Clostridium perfringens]
MKILDKKSECEFNEKYFSDYEKSRFYQNIDLDEYKWFLLDIVNAIEDKLTVEIAEPYYKVNYEDKPYKDFRIIKINIISCEIEEPNIENITLKVKELENSSIGDIKIKIDKFADKHTFGKDYSKYYVYYLEGNDERRKENLVSGNTKLEEKYRFIFWESK